MESFSNIRQFFQSAIVHETIFKSANRKQQKQMHLNLSNRVRSSFSIEVIAMNFIILPLITNISINDKKSMLFWKLIDAPILSFIGHQIRDKPTLVKHGVCKHKSQTFSRKSKLISEGASIFISTVSRTKNLKSFNFLEFIINLSRLSLPMETRSNTSFCNFSTQAKHQVVS